MDNIIPQKWCYKCATFKPLSDFTNNRSRYDGKASECRVCRKQISAQLQKQRPRPSGPSKTMRAVGFSWDDYKSAHEKQQGICAICGKPETGKNQWGVKKLAIDHDHVTGKFRGLLCQMCNMRLDALEDHAFISAARAYLDRHHNQERHKNLS